MSVMKHTRSDGPTELTFEQKRALYRDGYIILKNIWHVPKTPHFGDRSANVLGVNGTPLFQNPGSEWDGMLEVVAEAQNSGDQSDA